MFRALVVDRQADGLAKADVLTLSDDKLPDGNVTVDVEYSSINYKDGLCLSAQGGGLVRTYPHVPGIDFSGTVASSSDPRYAPGDKVILTGWRVGEVHWGGYAARARVKGDWLVPLPEGLTTRSAMAVGTAGLTAMLALIALEDHGLVPGKGEVLVTGATGGVGSVALSLLSSAGYIVAAVTGKPELEPYLLDLGAARIVPRTELAETVPRSLEKESWVGCIDAVGGSMLARILGQICYGGSVAAVGLAGGNALPASVIPFLLRGINLLGIDSVMQPRAKRIRAWERIARDLPSAKLQAITRVIGLAEVPAIGAMLLAGSAHGRYVVDLSA